MDQLHKRLTAVKLTIDRCTAGFDQWVNRIPRLKPVTNELGLRPSYLVGGAIFLFWGLFLVGVALNAICNVFGLLYPCYSAYKELTKSSPDPGKLAFWLKYLLMFFSWNALLDPLVSIFWGQGAAYYAAKSFALFALYQPRTRALETVFGQVVAFIRPYEKRLDENIDAIKGSDIAARFNDAVDTLLDGKPSSSS